MRTLLEKTIENRLTTKEARAILNNRVSERMVEIYFAELKALGLVSYDPIEKVYEKPGFRLVVYNPHDHQLALEHSTNILFPAEGNQRYWNPQFILESLIYQDLDNSNAFTIEDRCFRQHLRSGYFKEVYILLQKYRQLMDESAISKNPGFPKNRISKNPRPKRGPFPRLLPNKPVLPTRDDSHLSKRLITSLKGMHARNRRKIRFTFTSAETRNQRNHKLGGLVGG